MSFLTIIGIATGLSMDAFAVAISYGCSPQNVPMKHRLLISFSFGLFQALMPVIGWNMSKFFTGKINNYNHWIAFVLLVYIGMRMIIEALKNTGINSSSLSYDEYLFDLKKIFIL